MNYEIGRIGDDVLVSNKVPMRVVLAGCCNKSGARIVP